MQLMHQQYLVYYNNCITKNMNYMNYYIYMYIFYQQMVQVLGRNVIHKLIFLDSY